MKLEDLVPSLELCKELKENGYPQETAFYWTIPEGRVELAFILLGSLPNIDDELLKAIGSLYFAAPTASEIGEQLSKRCISYWLNDNYHVELLSDKPTPEGIFSGTVHHEESSSAAETNGKMWIYLKKNGLLQEQLTSK